MSSDTAARAGRVAGAIGVFKWILLGIILLGAGLYALEKLGSGADNAPTIGVVVAVGAAINALMIWVLLWGLEHTLRALAEINANTEGLRNAFLPDPAGAAPSPAGLAREQVESKA